MAPNIAEVDLVHQKSEENKQKKPLEIYCDGYFYDVTSFVDRHPGGTIIKFYTESGEDATQAIEQFHYRSKGRVDAILKTFKKRPADLKECISEPTALTRHQAMSHDFKNLFEELQAEGFFEPSIRHIILRLVEALSMVVLGHGFCSSSLDAPFFERYLGALFLGFGYSRFGWIQHEGGHNSLTGYPKIDKMLQMFSFSFIMGGSSVWWNSMHNRHHAMPQRLHHDVDMSELPYITFNKGEVKDKNKILWFFVRYQAILYATLDLLGLTIAAKFFIHPRFQLRKRAYHEMVLTVASFYFIWYYGFGWYMLGGYWGIFFLGINFQLSHSHLEATDKPTHWLEYSLTHTANITPSLAVDYWMGYLNYQIEHHLFPTMPQFRQREISHRVKALAEKHGLSYKVYGYWEAMKLVFKNLDDVGKELTRPETTYTK